MQNLITNNDHKVTNSPESHPIGNLIKALSPEKDVTDRELKQGKGFGSYNFDEEGQEKKIHSIMNNFLNEQFKQREKYKNRISLKGQLTSLKELNLINRKASINRDLKFKSKQNKELNNIGIVSGKKHQLLNIFKKKNILSRHQQPLFKNKLLQTIDHNDEKSEEKSVPFDPEVNSSSIFSKPHNSLSDSSVQQDIGPNAKSSDMFASSESHDKVKKAVEYFQNVKKSIKSFEDDNGIHFNKKNLHETDKNIIMAKYIKKMSMPEIIKINKQQIDKKSFSDTKDKTSRRRRNGFLHINHNVSDVIDSHSFINPTEKEEFRSLQKSVQVNDSISEDEEHYIENLMFEYQSIFAIDPHSPYKKYWDLIIISITIYSLIFTPIYIAFIEEEIYLLTILEVIFDILFISDIIINFFVGYYNYEEELVKNIHLITINYLTGWFAMDLIASVPGSLIVFIINSVSDGKIVSKNISAINKATRFTRLYRMIKFTKLFKIVKISKNDQKNVSMPGLEEMNLTSSLHRFLQFIVTFFVCTHMLTCIWIFIGKSDYPNWLSKSNISDASAGEMYTASLYFHWATIFTIGYGDILAYTFLERTYSSILMFFGILIYSFAVSSLGNIVSNYDTITARYYKNIELLDDLRMKYNLPDLFYNKLAKYLKYDFQFNKNEKFSFIAEIPLKLRNELLKDMYKDIIVNFIFLNGCSSAFVSKVVFNMRPMRAFRKEYLVVEGQLLEEVFFVRKGVLNIHMSPEYREAKVMSIKANEHFGDVLVISKSKSPVAIKISSKIADLLIIRKQDFSDIAKEFPQEFEDSILLSSYNYIAMLEIVKQKKEKIDLENEQNKDESHKDNKESLPNKSLNKVNLSKENEMSEYFDVFHDLDIDFQLQQSKLEDDIKNLRLLKMNSESEEEQTKKVISKKSTNTSDLLLSTDLLSQKLSTDSKFPNLFNFNFVIQNNNYIGRSFTTDVRKKSSLSYNNIFKELELKSHNHPGNNKSSDNLTTIKSDGNVEEIYSTLKLNANNESYEIKEDSNKKRGSLDSISSSAYNKMQNSINLNLKAKNKEEETEIFNNPQSFFAREFKSWIQCQYEQKYNQQVHKLMNFYKNCAKKFNLVDNLIKIDDEFI